MMAVRSEVAFRSFPNSRSELQLYGAHEAAVGAGWSCRKHLHPMMLELNLVLEGTQWIELNGTTLRQGAGELLLLPPMRLHALRADDELRYFVLHVQIDDPDLFPSIGRTFPPVMGSGHPLHARLAGSMERLLELLRNGEPRTKSYRLLYAMLDELETYAQTQPAEAADGTAPAIARAIEALVHAPHHDRGPLPNNWLEGIAGQLGISRRHGCRVFRSAYGMTPRDYLGALRQQEAMHLLASGSEPVEQIAYRIGYDSAQSFIRQFVKWTGCTPGVFRKERGRELDYLTPLELR